MAMFACPMRMLKSPFGRSLLMPRIGRQAVGSGGAPAPVFAPVVPQGLVGIDSAFVTQFPRMRQPIVSVNVLSATVINY